MRVCIKCTVCGATSWHDGWEEYDTNSAGVDDDDDLSEACTHIQNGGDYSIIDSDYESNEDDYL